MNIEPPEDQDLASRLAITVLVGVGEMGGVFAKGLLRAGRTVVPVGRSTNQEALAELIPGPDLVLVTVGESDLDATLAALPAVWRDRVGLLQNELLPHAWERHDISRPTVASVWFEKKPGRAVKVIIPTPIAGPAAGWLVDVLGGIGIPATEVEEGDALVGELVAKNLYILTANIAGLETGGTVGQLWNDHRELATAVATDVLDLQDALVGRAVDREAAIAGMVTAFEGDPEHGTTGRSAPERLRRAIAIADRHDLAVPTLRGLLHELDHREQAGTESA